MRLRRRRVGVSVSVSVSVGVRFCAGSYKFNQHACAMSKKRSRNRGVTQGAALPALLVHLACLMAQMHTGSLCSGAKHTMRQLGQ